MFVDIVASKLIFPRCQVIQKSRNADTATKETFQYFFFYWCHVPDLHFESQNEAGSCRELCYGNRKILYTGFETAEYFSTTLHVDSTIPYSQCTIFNIINA